MNIIEIPTVDGVIEIREDELASITDDQLEWMKISRADLHRCFAEGVELMQGTKPSDRLRICADRLHGEWDVLVMRYSPDDDPLMQGRAQGTA
jgi:hypothetical protein